MTPAQEQAPNAARKACIAWMRSETDKHDYHSACGKGLHSHLMSLPAKMCTHPHRNEVEKAYLAAWRTTWETA